MRSMNDNWKCLNCKFFKDHRLATVTYRGKLKKEYQHGKCNNKIFLNRHTQIGILNIDLGEKFYNDRMEVGINFGCIHFQEKIRKKK